MSDRSPPGPRAFALSWLFSPGEDLLAFAAPALLAIAITVALSLQGHLNRPLGPLGWLLAVVLVDVAHVYATIYRVYANPTELRRRQTLYLAIPIAAYAVGVGLYLLSGLTFWRVLAYLAVFHFVRQQYGWVALCGRREAAFTRADRWLDTVAVYVGTLYPLLYWHAHLPRRFHWFVEGDFLPPVGLLSESGLAIARALWLLVALVWLGRQLHRLATLRSVNLTRLIVMVTTWATWYLGMVYYNSDVAFTLTNVLPHGIPYFVLLFRYRSRSAPQKAVQTRSAVTAAIGTALLFYLPLVLLAFLEEGVWDRLVWHEHATLFPTPELSISELALCFLAPLLALPQSTHYLLDAWIWKVGPNNPDLRRHLGL